MANIQSTPRRVISARKVYVGSQNLTYNSTAIVASGGVKISNAITLTADSTGIVSDTTVAALPGNVDGGAQLAFLVNSTGRFSLAINTTGTTWAYLQVTSVEPTA